MKKLDFFARSEKLGHSAAALKKGESITSKISVPSIERLKEIFDNGGTPEEKISRTQNLFGKAAKGNVNDDFLQRVNNYLFGDTPLNEGDTALLSQAFPMELTAVSADDYTFNGRNDLGTSQSPVILNYGTVTMNDQAYITIQNTPLQFTCDTLVRNGSAPSGYGDFNILGATGGVGNTGETGTTGGNGSGGKNGNCSSAGIAGDSGQNGSPGNKGGTGGTGFTGSQGLPSQMAEITITTALNAASLTILTRSGTGGQGGIGGKGGTGGNGGKGGNGATCGCTGSGAGNGNSGGQGGPGGQGGQGGNAVDAAANITVLVPSGDISKVFPQKLQAPAGSGGNGGPGGNGGSGGGKGSGGKHNGDGSTGAGGGKGATGGQGLQGTVAGQPATINVQPY